MPKSLLIYIPILNIIMFLNDITFVLPTKKRPDPLKFMSRKIMIERMLYVYILLVNTRLF